MIPRNDGKCSQIAEEKLGSAEAFFAAQDLPFHPSGDLSAVGQDVVLAHRPLSLRNDRVGAAFRVQAAILELFRDFLRRNRFTEIVSSKIVSGGTEGGANLFRIDYFDRAAYLAQSPQFFKEHGVCGLERVFDTAHVYRAEPHATVRHLTEYFSLDLEMGFIDGPEDVIALERDLLSHVFAELTTRHADLLKPFQGKPLPSLEKAPAWEFSECLARLARAHRRSDLVDDLDPDAERQLCALAEKEHGVPAVFVVGLPLKSRPFYTHPRGSEGAAQSFDLLFRGLEITTGGIAANENGAAKAPAPPAPPVAPEPPAAAAPSDAPPAPVAPGKAKPKREHTIGIDIDESGGVRVDGIEGTRQYDSFDAFVAQAPWVAAMVFGVTIVVFLTSILIIALVIWYKMRKNRMLNETMIKLAERGVVPPAEALEAVAGGRAVTRAARAHGCRPAIAPRHLRRARSCHDRAHALPVVQWYFRPAPGPRRGRARCLRRCRSRRSGRERE